jgi:uncharacterized SAM-binding protein YcdF (DUF218 family)
MRRVARVGLVPPSIGLIPFRRDGGAPLVYRDPPYCSHGSNSHIRHGLFERHQAEMACLSRRRFSLHGVIEWATRSKCGSRPAHLTPLNLQSLMSALIDPAAWLWLLLLLLGILFGANRWRRAGLIILAVCICWWGIEVTALPGRLLARLEKPYAGSNRTVPPSADAVIVLGGWGITSTNEFAGLDLGPAADRLLTGIDLARRGQADALVVGGAATTGTLEPIEPELVRRWLARWELSDVPVLGLGPCRSTRDEAVRAATLARERGWTRVLLVTSAWHLERARGAFRAAGLETIPVACDFLGTTSLRRPPKLVPQAQSMVLLQIWLHEMVGYWYYRARGWV